MRDFTRKLLKYVFNSPYFSDTIVDSLVFYLQELDYLPVSALKKSTNLIDNSSGIEKKGEHVFKAKGCTFCHRPDFFFRDELMHRVDTISEISPWSFEGAVKTPSLLNFDSNLVFHDGRRWSEAILDHSGQELKKEEKISLKAYLDKISNVEKPYDQRHISELLLENLSMLKVFHFKSSIPHKKIIVQTVAHNLASLVNQLREPGSRKWLADRISILKTMTGENEQKLLEFEKKNRNDFLRLK